MDDATTHARRHDIPAWVADYIGIPFVEHGRDRNSWDCWGCVRLILDERFGIPLPSYAGAYPDTTAAAELGRLIRAEMTPWREVTGHERAGDVALLRVRGAPMHVGLVVAPGVMLHVEQGIDSMLERYDGPRWVKRLCGVYRYQRSENRDQMKSGPRDESDL